ncbi:PREDICTED: phospholipase A1-like [Polistes canadensis]|uniref:phospholipase A1-like n=1 Tax=Polistes canadensis TaxID=91411 RepID=UPI000719018C|nr:PREDICTED: phospholipase A1-like [Polistes canadensis]
MNFKYSILFICFVGVLHNSYADGKNVVLERGMTPDCTFNENDVLLYVYARDKQDFTILSKWNLTSYELFNHPEISHHQVVFLIHGFISSMSQDNFIEMAQALKEKDNCIVIGIDWKKGACNGLSSFVNLVGYPQAVKNTRLVGKYLSEVTKMLVDMKKVQMSNIRLIGHSLGAQSAGFAGKEVQKLNLGKYREIIGLDPAGPSFRNNKCPDRLCETDAEYVQVLHTSNMYGTYKEIGTVDFYVNYGEGQPICLKEPICSHNKAVVYFTQCIKHDCCLIGTPWTSYWSKPLELSKCTKETCVCIGLNAKNYPARGSFYAATAYLPPYCYKKGLKNEL